MIQFIVQILDKNNMALQTFTQIFIVVVKIKIIEQSNLPNIGTNASKFNSLFKWKLQNYVILSL